MQQGVKLNGTATVSETVSKMASANTTGHYSPELAETRPLLVNASEPDRFTIHKQIMNQRYIMFQRAGVFYCEDTTTGKQLSLRTKNEADALTLLHTKNESVRQPKLNLQIAKTYLAAADESFIKRTWREVMDEYVRTKSGSNRIRTERAVMDKSFDSAPVLPLYLPAAVGRYAWQCTCRHIWQSHRRSF